MDNSNEPLGERDEAQVAAAFKEAMDVLNNTDPRCLECLIISARIHEKPDDAHGKAMMVSIGSPDEIVRALTDLLQGLRQRGFEELLNAQPQVREMAVESLLG